MTSIIPAFGERFQIEKSQGTRKIKGRPKPDATEQRKRKRRRKVSKS